MKEATKNHLARIEEVLRRRKRKSTKETMKCALGIPHQPTNNHKRNNILPYGPEAVILVEFQVLSTQSTQNTNPKLAKQDYAIYFSLDQVEGKRNKAFMNMATYC